MASDNDTQQLCAPGYRMPLDKIPDVMFDNALASEGGNPYMPLTTLREFTMMKLMDEITDKPGWEKKIFDEAITEKWKKEALAFPGIDDVGVTQNMVDYVIAELQYKAKIFEQTQAVAVYNGDVVKSDTIIPESLRQSLIDATKPLEDVPSKQQDWHPGSDDKVLDLVHPSLFPLVYGKTRIASTAVMNLKNCIGWCGGGSVSSVSENPGSNDVDYKPYSTKFQWLPCEVEISDPKISKITSYINNLHPQKHKDLYAVLEKIIDCVIPLWSLTLAPGDPANNGNFRRDRLRINYTAECEYDYNPEELSETDEDECDYNPEELSETDEDECDYNPEELSETDEDEYDYEPRRRQRIENNAAVKQPDVGSEFAPPEENEEFDIRKKFAEKGLQVIVKLANIHLTPDKPTYDGGSWHVEGQLNEHICASAIYCYDSVNIISSLLSFRQRVSREDAIEIENEQNNDDWLTEVFGCTDWDFPVQEIGSIRTIQGRLITFPNLFQHQVQPFKLEDPTKPGHQKILALFLVDPHIKIISTKHVPCQRLDWWKEAIEEAVVRYTSPGASQSQSRQARGPGLADLTKELRDLVYESVDDFPMSMKEAKALRKELMDERSVFVDEQTRDFTGARF